MAVTHGTQGASGTPATDFYALLAAELGGNAHWTLSSDSPVAAVDAGTTGVVNVWTNDNGFSIGIEIDDTNSRVRVYAFESWDDVGHLANQPCGGGATGNSSVTPTVNATVTDTPQPIDNGDAKSAFSTVTTPAGGFAYLYEARDGLLTIATHDTFNSYAIVGNATSLITKTADAHPLMLFAHPGKTGVRDTAETLSNCNCGRASRSPGLASTATGGAFAVAMIAMHHAHYNNSAGAAATEEHFSYDPTNPSIYYNSMMATPIVIHGMTSNGLPGTGRGFRAYLPDFIGVVYGGGGAGEPAVGDTFTVDGTVYRVVGSGHLYASSNNPTVTSTFLAIKE